MRDAVAIGIFKMIVIKKGFMNTVLIGIKFVHVILTDGQDTHSKDPS